MVFLDRALYHGNKALPVFEWNRSMHIYKVNKIVQALLNDFSDGSKICRRVPTNIEHNCTFLIDRWYQQM